jgi:hypothetical protein
MSGIYASINNSMASLKRTVLLYPVPEVGWKPARLNLDAIAAGNAPPRYISTSWARFKQRNAEAERPLDSFASPNVRRIRPEDLFCNTVVKDRCVVQSNGVLYYADDNHLSVQGAGLAVDDLLRELNAG